MIISVAVITYNSSSTILETLNSIINQSYGSKNIELIISDDASTDNTVEMIDNWLSTYGMYFNKTIFIKNPINLGVSGNINKAWKRVSCQWVKSIAGDDLLDINCIELNIKYIQEHSECNILFSKMQSFGRSSNILPTPYDIRLFSLESKKQYEWLRSFSFNIAPSSFININVLREVNYADENYRMIEDLPLWLKITKSGYKLDFLNAVTVYYRTDESITISKEKFINREFIKDLIRIYQENCSNHLLYELIRYEKIMYYKVLLYISYKFSNKKSLASKLAKRIARLMFPIHLTQLLYLKAYNFIHNNSTFKER